MISYLVALLIVVVVAAIAGLALNLQWGLGGLVNFGLFGFYMLGAYICGILCWWHLPPLLAMLAAILGVTATSALVSLISIRLSEDYLAIVTLGFAECLRLFISYEEWLTRGTIGIPGIRRPLPGWIPEWASDAGLMVFALLCLIAVLTVFELVARSPFGRTLRATREDPAVASALGKSVVIIRLKAFALGGAALGIAGSLHAFYYTYVDPTQFSSIITAYAFMAVVIGGRGSNWGVLVSAFTVILLLEGSRFLIDRISILSSADLAALRLFLVGVVLVAILIFRPDGLLREPVSASTRDRRKLQSEHRQQE
ncbi:branched-chain amino acid ABC transporter permease [Bradyrhizobium sp.]|uniref:branched-chain amino acid ABC transporter permease n=1 Tax=Bradyrhizobium sp. TaxID=376 RepID=UPI0039E3AFAE